MTASQTEAEDRSKFCVLCVSGQHPRSVHATAQPEVYDDRACEKCDGPETDAEPMVECQSDGGSYHVGCHGQRCTSRSCHAYNGTDDAVEGL